MISSIMKGIIIEEINLAYFGDWVVTIFLCWNIFRNYWLHCGVSFILVNSCCGIDCQILAVKAGVRWKLDYNYFLGVDSTMPLSDNQITTLKKLVYRQIIPELKQSEPEFVEAVVPFIVYSLTAPFELQDKFENTSYTFMEYELEYEAIKVMTQRLEQVFKKFEINPSGDIGMCIIEIWRKSIEELGKMSPSWNDLYSVMTHMSNR